MTVTRIVVNQRAVTLIHFPVTDEMSRRRHLGELALALSLCIVVGDIPQSQFMDCSFQILAYRQSTDPVISLRNAISEQVCCLSCSFISHGSVKQTAVAVTLIAHREVAP